MVMQKKVRIITFLFKEFFSFFKKFVPYGIFQTNQDLLNFLDGHGSHVSLEAMKQAYLFGLDMVALPSHT
jgi:hypothetical protein